jgi:hypothetical protein
VTQPTHDPIRFDTSCDARRPGWFHSFFRHVPP